MEASFGEAAFANRSKGNRHGVEDGRARPWGGGRGIHRRARGVSAREDQVISRQKLREVLFFQGKDNKETGGAGERL